MFTRVLGTTALITILAFGAARPAAAAGYAGPYGATIQQAEVHCLLNENDYQKTQTRSIEVWTPGVSLAPVDFYYCNVGAVRWSTRIDVSADSGKTWSVWRAETSQDSAFAVSYYGYSANGFKNFAVSVPNRSTVNVFRVVSRFQFFDKAGKLLPQATQSYVDPAWTLWRRYSTSGIVYMWNDWFTDGSHCIV
jgi:hypothetical protein